MSDCCEKYKDIIDLPHHQSKKRQQMSLIDRAAQFSPFAALTGHNDAIIETARLTDRQIELDEGTKSIINEKIQMISDHLSENPTVTITHFEPDIKKDGGAYLSTTGTVKRIDEFKREILMTDGRIISIERISDIEGELFKGLE
ncbi:MAG: hypothetical protein IJ349_07000 [Clostridia bacterium]|nr:hypothetical protein [Clostridia bacterium]